MAGDTPAPIASPFHRRQAQWVSGRNELTIGSPILVSDLGRLPDRLLLIGFAMRKALYDVLSHWEPREGS